MWGSECRIKAIDDDVLNVTNTLHISKLGFEQLLNAAKKAQKFADATKFKDLSLNQGSKKVRDVIELYLQKSGYSPKQLATPLVNAMKAGVNIIEAQLLHKIWSLCVRCRITLD